MYKLKQLKRVLTSALFRHCQSRFIAMEKQEVMVTVNGGQLQGTTKYDWKGNIYYSFQGIPYGKPPVGKLRFKAPTPAESWTGILDSKTERSGCYSRDMMKNIEGSEDCLYLNVYTPQLPSVNTRAKPVMVWIHGGGFIAGSGSADAYGPDFLISEDVVVVTMNYRVGLLGFACFDDPALEVPGNAGLKDQVLALKWVQENISSFCGDSENVTIFGESAGGACVHYLMLSPMAKGLFHKAIAQSGTANCWWAQGQRTAGLIADVLNLNTTKEAQILKIIEEMPVDQLFELQEKIPDPLVVCEMPPIGPVVEKSSKEPAFLLEEPINLLRSGRYHHVPLIVGYNSREGIVLEIKHLEHGEMKWLTDFEEAVPIDLIYERKSSQSKYVANRIKDFYYGPDDSSYKNISRYHLLQTDSFFFVAINNAVRHQTLTSSAPIYYYRMSLDTELNIYKKLCDSSAEGTCHGDDLGYLFKNLFTPEICEGSAEDIGLRRVIKLWTNFARTGNPNPIVFDSLIDTTWLPTQPNEMHFLDIGENLIAGTNPELERVQFWDELYSLKLSTSKL